MQQKDFRRDAEVDCFLLDSYESTLFSCNTSTPIKAKCVQVANAPALSSISSGTDRAEQQSAPEVETLEQRGVEFSIEVRIDLEEEGPSFHGYLDDSYDEEYLPTISLRMGGALKGAQVIDNLPTIGIDETVHDLPAPEVPLDEPLSLELPILPGPQKVLNALVS
ncbi:hypothetical protein F2P79_008448 [Pimephales promelas]|nr:hypothetical protein F2P79_008448 [Pimephales promelas]